VNVYEYHLWKGLNLRSLYDRLIMSAHGGSKNKNKNTSPTRVSLLAADYQEHVDDVAAKLGVANAWNIATCALPSISILSGSTEVLVVWTASWAIDGGATAYDQRKAGNLLADFVKLGGRVVMCYTNPAPTGKLVRSAVKTLL
jgi:hypothetical protein